MMYLIQLFLPLYDEKGPPAHLDRQWWDDYRQDIEARFRLEEVLIRAQVIEII
jgi:hypothetical protein